MADPKEPTTAEDEKAKKAAADKAAKEAAVPQPPSPSQAEADAIKEGKPTPPQARDVKAQSTTANYKTR